MAIDRNARYPGRFDAPTTARPQGAFKNRTAPGAKDGSYLERDWANDWDGFFGSLMRSAGLTANGTPDTALASQYFDALTKKIADAVKPKVSGTNLTNAGFTSDGIPFFRTTDIAEITPLAKLSSPDFLGIPKAPTAAAGTFSKQIANLEFVGEAIRLLFTKRGFSANDFIRIPDQPGGLIIQWGRIAYTDISVSLSIPITLSTPFPTVNLGVIGNVESSAQNAYCTTTSRNLSSAVLNLTESSSIVASGTVFWIAIGN